MKGAACALATASVILLNAPPAMADSLGKDYFAVTPPGAWAKYESSWEMPDGTAGASVYTYIRAPDSDGRARVEITTETVAGPGEGVITRQLFVMEPGFDLARDFMNHMSSLEASVVQTGEGPPTVMQDDVIEILRGAGGDLTNSVTIEGKATVDGRACDRYRYSYSTGGPYVTLQEGEICLDDAVPFGVVHQKGRSTDESGAMVSSYEQRLVDSGTGQSANEALLAMTPMATAAVPADAAPGALPMLPLAEAYQSGRIRLLVEVVPGTGGRRLEVTTLNQSEEAFDLVVPGGPLTIPADSPLGELNVVFAEEHRYTLSPGASSPSLPAGQSGQRGATDGSFQLTVYEGTPLYQGSVEVGPLE